MATIQDISASYLPLLQVSICSVEDAKVYELHPDEQRALSDRASAIRKSEFHLGRAAANECLEKMGFAPTPPVPQGFDRAPIWPEGVIGSISHSGRWAVAAIGRNHEVRMIGVDIERTRPMSVDRLSGRIATDEEAELLKLHQESDNDFPFMQTVIFSAKESIYKAFFGTLNIKLKFADISFAWDKEEMDTGEATLYGTISRYISPRYRKGFVFPVKAYRFDEHYALTLAVDSFSDD